MSTNPTVILSDDGTSFASKGATQTAIKQKELDPKRYVPGKHGGGWAIFDLEDLAIESLGDKEAPVPPPMKYFEVEFQAKSSENQEDDVTLAVQGAVLQFQRNVPVVIPENYLLVCDDAGEHQWVNIPDEVRMVKGPFILKYPYRKIREVTREEYLKRLQAGIKERNTKLAERGLKL